MWESIVFGVLASSALVIGGALGAIWQAPKRVTGIMLAFASGTLVSALAFELFPDAVERGGVAPAGWGLLAGAATFVVVNTWLDSRVAQPGADAGHDDRKASDDDPPGKGEAEAAARGEVDDLPEELSGAAAEQSEKVRSAAGAGVGLALLAAVALDGIPENLALGVSLAGSEEATESLALLVAIFASNFPEALVGAVAMRLSGRSVGFAVGLWAATAVILTFAVVGGRMLLAGAAPERLAFPLAFAGGAVLASLADTLMPEAFERGRPFNAFATAAGFFVSFVLAEL
jgi:ZIP family zinc transporter